MVNIAFISNYFGIGGMERTFLSIAENLRGKGYSFHFINLADKFFQNRFYKCGRCFHSSDLSDIINYLTDNKIDIIQTCNCDDGSYLAYLAGIRTIIERPDGLSSAFLSDKTPVSSIICSTDKVYEKTKLLFPEKYIEKVYNGVDTAVFYHSEKNKVLLNQLNLKPENTVIGYCGRIAEQKCLHNLIDVFFNINAKFPTTRLIVLGDEFPKNCGYKKKLIDKTHKLSLDNKILFCGATEHPEKFINLFDVSVLCSGSHKLPDGNFEVEGIPNAIMESMAMGIPTVAASSGETDILVKNNENGFLNNVDEWDKLQKNLEILVTDPALRHKMGSAARQHIKTNFSLNSMISKYDDIYRFSINPDFSTKYPDVFKKIKSHFLSNEFINQNNQNIKDKKVLVIKSGSDFLFNFLIEDINKLFDNPDISILTNKTNLKKLKPKNPETNFFIYDKSENFSVENMDKIIKKLNKENFDYLFFLFNDLQGKNYENIKNLVYRINAKKKIVMNKLLRKFIFS